MAQDTSLQALNDYVRNFLEVDDTDIPDSLMAAWAYSAFDDLIGQAVNWPFYEVGENADGVSGILYQIQTVVGTQNYALPTVTVQGIQANVNAHNLIAVQGPHWELMYGGTTELEKIYTPAFTSSQEPERYSIWGQTGLTFWPIPNQALTFNIRAYRDPIDWIGLGPSGLVDAPNDFWSAMAHYCLSMGWANQTDLQSASFWNSQYQQAKGRLLAKYIQSPRPESIVLNGSQNGVGGLPPRLKYPFESATDF